MVVGDVVPGLTAAGSGQVNDGRWKVGEWECGWQCGKMGRWEKRKNGKREEGKRRIPGRGGKRERGSKWAGVVT